MGELQIQQPFSLPPPPLPPIQPPPLPPIQPPPLPPIQPPPSSSRDDSVPSRSSPKDGPPPPPTPAFDPSRMIGIIRRKALIKDLAAVYHAECLSYCQELLELQKKLDEPFIESKAPEEPRKQMLRPSKRLKKSR